MKFTIPRLALNAQKPDYVPVGQSRWSKARPVGRQSRCKIVTVVHDHSYFGGLNNTSATTRIYFGGVEAALAFREGLERQRAELTTKECTYNALYEDIIDDITANPRFDLWRQILRPAFNALDAVNAPDHYLFSYRMHPYRQQDKSTRILCFQAVSAIGEPFVTL